MEKRGSRLVYRKSALDAFLSENGIEPQVWIQASWKKVADQLREVTEATGDEGFDRLIETLDKLWSTGWLGSGPGKVGALGGAFRNC